MQIKTKSTNTMGQSPVEIYIIPERPQITEKIVRIRIPKMKNL
jgi:hypothetical protein